MASLRNRWAADMWKHASYALVHMCLAWSSMHKHTHTNFHTHIQFQHTYTHGAVCQLGNICNMEAVGQLECMRVRAWSWLPAGCTCDMKAVGQLRCICMYMCWGSCWTAGIHAYTNMKLFVSWGAHVMWKLLCSWGNTHTHSSEAAHACKVGTWAGKAFFPHKQLLGAVDTRLAISRCN